MLCRVFANRVLRKIFGPKREEVAWGWRKLHNEELSDLYSPLNNVQVIKSIWLWHVARMGEKSGIYKVLVGKPESKRPPGRLRRRWVDNTKRIFRNLHVGGGHGLDLSGSG